MELKQKQVLDDMSVMLRTVVENSNLVDYSREEHHAGGYIANIANIGFGTLRAPDGTVSIFPQVHFIL